MDKGGHILIADDEETFLESTSELLRCEGFYCDAAPDAFAAKAMLVRNPYDLLIADINMPGNSKLEFIKELPEIVPGIPVILVTGYPTVNTALDSLRLPVVTYLVKPIDFKELLLFVKKALRTHRASSALIKARHRIETWKNDLDSLGIVFHERGQGGSDARVLDFITLSLSNIIGSLADLKNLTELSLGDDSKKEPCHLLECPRREALSDAIHETITVLEKTRHHFKSKELGELRKKLEQVIQKQT